MLETIGVSSIEDLFDEIPRDLLIKDLEGVPEALSEQEISRLMRSRRTGSRRALFYWCRRLRTSYPSACLGLGNAWRILQCVHTVSGRGKPGHVADDLRIPDDDDQPHRDGRQ